MNFALKWFPLFIFSSKFWRINSNLDFTNVSFLCYLFNLMNLYVLLIKFRILLLIVVQENLTRWFWNSFISFSFVYLLKLDLKVSLFYLTLIFMVPLFLENFEPKMEKHLNLEFNLNLSYLLEPLYHKIGIIPFFLALSDIPFPFRIFSLIFLHRFTIFQPILVFFSCMFQITFKITWVICNQLIHSF